MTIDINFKTVGFILGVIIFIGALIYVKVKDNKKAKK